FLALTALLQGEVHEETEHICAPVHIPLGHGNDRCSDSFRCCLPVSPEYPNPAHCRSAFCDQCPRKGFDPDAPPPLKERTGRPEGTGNSSPLFLIRKHRGSQSGVW